VVRRASDKMEPHVLAVEFQGSCDDAEEPTIGLDAGREQESGLDAAARDLEDLPGLGLKRKRTGHVQLQSESGAT
jgi:hypothetical protein